jgi:C1A family cysteine protease
VLLHCLLLQVYDDMKPFFVDQRNRKAVYRPSPRAQLYITHAVVLVGYNNQQQFWLAKNSWGSNWGDSGLFKVGLVPQHICEHESHAIS